MKPLFLFSLPRSGSTLSQRILGAHPEVVTVTEPYILLPYLYSLRERGIYAEYNHEVTLKGIQDFCQELPQGEDDYRAELRRFVMRLYTKAAKSGGQYFLDKTPHYSFVAQDIIRLFPQGKFIFLWRNPLSIASSFLETWNGGRWNLYQYDVHLFRGLASLTEAYQRFADSACAIRYEDILARPEAEWKRVFAYLELPYDAQVISRFTEVSLRGRLQDPLGTGKYTNMSPEPLEKWRRILANPIRKAWSRRYLNWIGQERLAVMGYDLKQLLFELQETKLSWRFAASDLWWIPYGSLYQFFDGRILKHKLDALRAGQRVYVHR